MGMVWGHGEWWRGVWDIGIICDVGFVWEWNCAVLGTLYVVYMGFCIRPVREGVAALNPEF